MTPEQRAYCAARTRARLAQKKAAARIRPAAFTALERTGTVDESIRPLVPAVDAWRARMTEDLGGPDALSTQYESLLSVASVLLLSINTLTAMFLQGSGDRLEIASKIGTLIGQFRATLQALGLERHHKEIDLATYLESRRIDDAPRPSNGGAAPTAIEDVEIVDVEPSTTT